MDILYLIIGPFLLSLFIYSWIEIIGIASGLPLIPILVLIGFWSVKKTNNKSRWILLIFLLAIVESLIFLYWFGLHVEFTKQVAIQTGGTSRWDGLLTVYKIFRN